MPGDGTVETRGAADDLWLGARERVEDGDLELARKLGGHLAFDRCGRRAVTTAGIGDEKEQPPHPLTDTDTVTRVRGAKSVMSWMLVPSAFST